MNIIFAIQYKQQKTRKIKNITRKQTHDTRYERSLCEDMNTRNN